MGQWLDISGTFYSRYSTRYQKALSLSSIIDEEGSLNPEIKEILDKGLCTVNATNGGQFYFECSICDKEFCGSCMKSYHRHERKEILFAISYLMFRAEDGL